MSNIKDTIENMVLPDEAFQPSKSAQFVLKKDKKLELVSLDTVLDSALNTIKQETSNIYSDLQEVNKEKEQEDYPPDAPEQFTIWRHLNLNQKKLFLLNTTDKKFLNELLHYEINDGYKELIKQRINEL